MLIFQVPTSEEIIIAPGEGKKPSSILQNKYWEKLAFPEVFSNDKFGCKVEPEVKLSQVKHFNMQLLTCKQLSASNSDYIFFALSVTQQLKLNSQICGKNLNTGMFSGKYQGDSSLLEKIQFRGFVYGKTSWATNFFYGTGLC